MLAPDVQLIGEMQGTGFKDRQWLIRRQGRFIQVTELLYKLAEQANGQHTLEEIAEKVTEATDWSVSPDNVRQLIRAKLMPLGLMAMADGTVAPDDGAAGRDRERSPLAVQLRLRALSPRLIEPITQALQVLHALPVLVPVLIAAALAHGWLYSSHGVSQGIRDALYRPGGLLLILAITIASDIFHEFGHASALRYGGGKVRGMGVGVYLIYPAFYTDVTDSYRLGRWARVRTDLGGVYFHLIVALGLIVLSAIAGIEFLLAAVLLINVQVIRQFLPLGRFDGYWMLADLTGIPDLFSQMGPFLRGALPVLRSKGGKLPDLKPWVKAVFAIYTITTIPVLVYLFYLMIWGLPRFLATTGDALLTQTGITSAAWSHGDSLIIGLSGIQMVLLALPALGTLYLIYSVVRIPIRVVSNYIKLPGHRRLADALGAAVVTVLLGLLLAPQLGQLAGSQAVQADAPAQAPAVQVDALKQTREATRKLTTLRADLEGSLGPNPFTGTVVFKRPNLARIDIKSGKGADSENVLIVSDGRNLFTYLPALDRYIRSVPGPDGRNIHALVTGLVECFFRPDSIGVVPAGGRSAYLGKEMMDGTEYDIVEITGPAPQGLAIRYSVSPKDRLIRREAATAKGKGGETVSRWVRLKNIRTDEPVDESAFRWVPPPTAKEAQRTMRPGP
jgi:outer membrane lipoprotein-sorting protein